MFAWDLKYINNLHTVVRVSVTGGNNNDFFTSTFTRPIIKTQK